MVFLFKCFTTPDALLPHCFHLIQKDSIREKEKRNLRETKKREREEREVDEMEKKKKEKEREIKVRKSEKMQREYRENSRYFELLGLLLLFSHLCQDAFVPLFLPLLSKA